MAELTEDVLSRFDMLSRNAIAARAVFVAHDAIPRAPRSADVIDPAALQSLVAELRRWRSTRQGQVDWLSPELAKGPTARTAEEWRAVAMWLASALRLVRQMSPVTHADAIDHLIEHALREAGLD